MKRKATRLDLWITLIGGIIVMLIGLAEISKGETLWGVLLMILAVILFGLAIWVNGKITAKKEYEERDDNK